MPQDHNAYEKRRVFVYFITAAHKCQSVFFSVFSRLFSAVRAAAECGRRDPDMLVKDRAEMLRIFIPDLGGNRADALVTVQQQLLGTLNPLCNHIVFDRDTGLLRKDIT